MIFTIIITQFYFYRVTPFNTGPLYLVLKCLIFCAHAINYCIFKRHQWLIQNLTMKTCSFLDPVTSKFLLIVNAKCELAWAFGKQNLLCHVLDIFPFLQLTFFSGIGFAHTGRYKPKTKRVLLCLNLLVVSTFYISILAEELHKDAAESWKVWLTYATAFSKTKRS